MIPTVASARYASRAATTSDFSGRWATRFVCIDGSEQPKVSARNVIGTEDERRVSDDEEESFSRPNSVPQSSALWANGSSARLTPPAHVRARLLAEVGNADELAELSGKER